MIPYARQEISQDDIKSVINVLNSDWLTQGPVVTRFEKAVSEYTNVKFGVATNSATSALHIACLALEVGPGDMVWTSANTFVASANCALYCGAEVDFVDIDKKDNNICVSSLRGKLIKARKMNRLPKVVIPVHFSGHPCDMVSINKLAQEFGFKVIEDASHAIGASYHSYKVGNCKHSDITIFSFHPVKIITSGEGGMALTNNPLVAEKMIQYRSHGITNNAERMKSRPLEEIWNYQQTTLGYNYRITDIQAALGLSQLSNLDKFISQRNTIVDRYNDKLKNAPILRPIVKNGYESSNHLYVIKIKKELIGKSQKEIYNSLIQKGIIVNLHYIPVYLHPYYQNKGFDIGYCPNAELYYKEAISLPIYTTLTEENQLHVINTLINICKKN